MNRILLLVIFIGIGYLTARSENVSDNPLSFNEPGIIKLNGTWDFKYIPSITIGNDSLFYTKDFDISGWANIQVPGHWELQGFAEPSYNSVKEGIGLYRRTFTIPEGFKNKQIFIQFDGVLYGYDVFVNGNYVGNWAGAFNAASFNITDFIDLSGENLLAVKVSTHPRGFAFDMSDCWGLSGIFRDVKIFSTPDIYINDYTVQTIINNDGTSLVSVSVKINNPDKISKNQLEIKGELISPLGKIKSLSKPVKELSENTLLFKVKSPLLWTAETPNLYNLKLSLIREGQVIQRKNQVVGIREISTDNAVLKLNGKAVKLRGVNHHDLVPATGRTMTREQILTDLLLMKKANINYIRTSHYPPDYRLLDMCDSLGIYVSCEIPFNYGRALLTDTTYQDILLHRAKATLFRDKNHPSIIIWTVGNENPSTKITEVTGRYVKKNDPTRPMCFAGLLLRSEKRPTIRADEPDFVDISSHHYKSVSWIRENRAKAKHPFVMTEYAHALGTAFGNMEDTWNEIFSRDNMAGGAVWMFQDQGIYRKADKPVDIHELKAYVWIDSVSFYDTGGDRGVDGIVYSDRTPQVDFWQVRKVYSPIQIIETEIPVNEGIQNLKFQVYNQFDFLNLNKLKGKWELLKNREVVGSGEIKINCLPHDTVTQELTVVLPGNLEDNTWLLHFDFWDETGMAVYEHAARLLPPKRLDLVKQEICLPENTLKTKGSDVIIGKFNYSFSQKDFSVQLSNQFNQKELIVGGLYARTGRLGTINDKTVRDKDFPETMDYPWDPHLLTAAGITQIKETQTDKEYRLSGTAKFLKGERFPGQSVEGDITYKVESDGILTVNYDLVPENTTGILLEAGISFKLSKEISDFIWLGDGPFASYPDKHLLNDFGVHYLKKGDLNFNGNRANVEIAVLTDIDGNGIAVIGDCSNISVELIKGNIIVSHNALLSGVGNKKSKAIPEYLVDAAQTKQIRGSFQIVPLEANHWPKKLIEIIGNPDKSKKAYTPFYSSYDWSR